MLQEWGIRGMKAVDVYGLDPEALVILPQPVHGLIFLYPYRDGDWGEQMEPCPDHVWFANQVDGTNACATVALMNIVNNVPNANLGSSLQSFKSDTKPMTAAERGNHLNDFHHIKAVHNSFIRINEMMEDDIAAEKDHEAREKQASIDAKKKAAAKLAAKKKKAAEKTAKKRERVAAKATAKAATEGNSTRVSPADKTGAGVTKSGAATKKKSAAKKTTSANTKKKVTTPAKPKKETPAMAKAATKKKADALARARYHYVAYLPINGEIWKLDGMDDEPLHLGACDNATWLDSVAPLIQASMADLSEDGINFSILAVVQDPLYNDTMDLAANIKTMQQVHEELAKVDSEWPLHPDAADCLGDESLDGPSDDYKVTEDMIDAATITSSDQEQILEPKGVGSLLGLKKKLTSQQKMLKSSIRLGKAEEDKRQAQVDRRRRDFGPLIQWQLMDLMDNGVLDDLLDKHDANKKDAKKGNAKAAAGKGKGKSKGRKR
jgi:ubiquitin carboxyl-terminal hydrolase L5